MGTTFMKRRQNKVGTGEPDHSHTDDDASSNSFMDTLFGFDDDVEHEKTASHNDDGSCGDLHQQQNTLIQRRQQELMQHQIRMMLESSESARQSQQLLVPADRNQIPNRLNRETFFDQSTFFDHSDPSISHPALCAPPAYHETIPTPPVSERPIPPRTTGHPYEQLGDGTTYTPLTRLYAMAGEYFPTTCQEEPATKRRKRGGTAGHGKESSVPVTCMSPSLAMATLNNPQSKKKTKPAERTFTTPTRSPQRVLGDLLQSKGLPLYRVCAIEAKYDTLPSQLQVASYGVAVMKAIDASDVAALDALLKVGLSPNPCNHFRDSLLDYVCKTSNEAIFHCFLRNRAELRVCDAFGRTPLHYCAWSKDFNKSIVRTILERDPQQLYMEDKCGQTPLEAVSDSAAQDWIDFLQEEQDKLLRSIPEMTSMERRVQLSDPPNSLSISAAKVVSSGKVAPEDIHAKLSPLTAPPAPQNKSCAQLSP